MKLLPPFAFLLSCFLAVGTHAKDSQKPNVLFIAIDDLNDWVGFLDGHPQETRRTKP
jgi:hypothetical protein